MANYTDVTQLTIPTLNKISTLSDISVKVTIPEAPDPYAPYVPLFSPSAGEIIPTQIISFDVLDSSPLDEDEGGIMVFANYTDYGIREVIYDGDSFVGEYTGTVQPPSEFLYIGEYRLEFTIERTGGWFASPMQIIVQSRDLNGNVGIDNVIYTINPDPTPPPPDAVAPVVGSFSPLPGETLQPSDTIQFDVTDNSGNFARIIVIAWFKETGEQEVVHDGDGFVGYYTATSSRVIISGGYRYYVLRSGGWRYAPTIRVFSIDATGNEA